MAKPPYCCKAGYLVGTSSQLPDDPRVYYKEERWPIIGCNRLSCDQCGQPVRQWPGYVLARGPHALARADHEQLYRTDDPSTSPLLRRSSEYRTYGCLCWADSVNSPWSIRSYMEFDHWGCDGHPQD